MKMRLLKLGPNQLCAELTPIGERIWKEKLYSDMAHNFRKSCFEHGEYSVRRERIGIRDYCYYVVGEFIL